MVQVRIGLGRHPHVENADDAQHPIALPAKLRRVLGLYSTPDIPGDVTSRIALDARDTQGHAPLVVVAAKAAAIAPRRVEVTVVGPRYRPTLPASYRCP